MRFSGLFLDSIRDQVDLSTIVGRYAQWDAKKTNRRKREFWARCVFHSEKTASFKVDDRRGRFHCFGCGKSGDHFSFLIEKSGRSFTDAVEELASLAGLPMPTQSPEETKRQVERLTLLETMAAAAKRFAQNLSGAAIEYLRKRTISADSVKSFGIGYSSSLAGLPVDHLKRGGLIASGESGDYPRFRDRVTFPISDTKGRIISFGGRSLDPAAEAKYLNGPETELFSKGKVLYNYPRARDLAWEKSSPVVVTEGYFDAISLCQGGFASVASMGTALTEEQWKLLWRVTDEPIVCFDGDGPGRKAASRSAEMLLGMIGPDRSAKFALLPPGHDPDSLIRQRGPEAIDRVIESSVTLADMIWRDALAKVSAPSPERMAALETHLHKILGQIADKDLRFQYQRDMRQRLKAFTAPMAVVRSNGHSHHSMAPSGIRLAHGVVNNSGMPLKDAILIQAVRANPETALEVAEELLSDRTLSERSRTILGNMVERMSAGEELEDLTDDLEEAAAKVKASAISDAVLSGVLRQMLKVH